MHVAELLVLNMSLHHYFKPTTTSAVRDNDPTLSSPDGPLSRIILSSTIERVNKRVSEAIKQDSDTCKDKKHKQARGTYMYEKYSATDKAKIANYAIQHSAAAAIRPFSKEHPGLKWSSVNDWKAVAIKKIKENLKVGKDEQVKEIVDKER